LANVVIVIQAALGGALDMLARKWIPLLVLACLAATPAYADSEDYPWYAELGLGVSNAPKSDLEFSGVSGTGTLDYAPGFYTSAAFGRSLPFRLRTEASFVYRRFTNESLRYPGLSCPDTPAICTGTGAFKLDGETHVMTFMGNVFYDIFAPGSAMRLYVGAGVGAAYAIFDEFESSASDVDDKDARFAWNVMAGMRFPVVDHIDSVIGYRYVRALDFAFSSAGFGMTSTFQAHDVVIALQYAF